MSPHEPGSVIQSTCENQAITPQCPIDCLLSVLSARPLNFLARAYDAPFDPPRTVGDVIDLSKRRRLGKIRGLGPRHIGEIEVCLVFLGFDTRRHRDRTRRGLQ